MVIAIDGVAANDKERVGVPVYTYELLKYFHKSASDKLRFKVYLKDPPASHMPTEAEFFKYRVVPGSFFWSRIFFPLALNRDRRADVFFSPAHYLPPFVPCPSVVTIHDLAYLFYPQYFLKKDRYKLTNWTKSAVNKSKKIIAVSNSTKKDVIKNYHVEPNKIKVIYNGYNKHQITNAKFQTNSKFKIQNSKFILYVGTIHPKKNLTTLIDAFSLLLSDHSDLKLVLAGKRGWLDDNIYQKVTDLSLAEKIIFTGFLEDATLDEFYKKAKVFVLPSLYEGFGLPLLEAMARGCPVIAADSSSLPEVGADACLYFKSDDKIDLKNKIAKVLTDEKLKKDLIKKGLERVKFFSWEKCAKETLEVLMATAKNNV